ncbi:uncharacterized protein [Arachis hypogaea]|uniref:uncharacterized protein n=1 Tax=Arachis hypogaea TaxID=3818 RepID=UPI003B227004
MKKNGKLRVCIDFRDLNNATPKDEYFMPIADMLIDYAVGNEILSLMDSYSGYNQIFIAEDDVSKIAFRCPGALGTYEWVVMPFGLKNAGATYQRAMNAIFHEFIGKFMKVYIDDVMVKSISNDSQFEWTKAHQLAFDSIKNYLSKVPIMANVRPHESLKLYIAASESTIGYFLVDNSKDLNDQGANVIEVKIGYWKLYFDGSKHKDGIGVGILIVSPEEIPSKFLFEIKYPCSNNETEYEALILGLEILINKGVSEVQILGDSKLVLKQLSKEFKCNNERLQKYLTTAWELLTSFQKISLVHIPRIQNEMANELAQITSKYKIGPGTLKNLASIHQILVPASEREVLCIDEWEDINWRKPIAQYLKDPNIPVDRKMKLRAMNFVLIVDELYKKGVDGSLLRCLGQNGQNISLGEVHNGICGAHQIGKKMRWVLYRNHVY